MKTINTTLPFYDRIEKQAYRRSLASHFDKLVPVLTPQYRLPSFLINAETDAPGEITSVNFYDKDGVAYTKDSGFYGWLNYMAGWDTFTLSGLDIVSAIQLNAADAYAICRNYSPDTGGITSGSYKAKAGETINIKGTYTHNSGAVNRLCIFDIGFTEDYGVNLVTGSIDISYTFPADGEFYVLIHQPTALASSFSFTGVEIGISNGISFFQTTDSYIQGVPGGAWSSATYDTFTCPASQTAITSAIKTTAAGEANCYNTVIVGSVPAGIATGEKLRIVVTLTHNSGTAPKIVLRNTGTGAVISNIVTLAAGVNYVFLIATTTLATGWAIYIYNSNTELSNWSATFADGAKSVLPNLLTAHAEDYFQYVGNTLGHLIPAGIYYLKISTSGGYDYYSEWFEVDCVYKNLITAFTNVNYDTWTVSGTELAHVADGAGGYAYTDGFSVITGEVLTFITFVTNNGGQFPYIYLRGSGGGSISASHTLVAGLNVVSLVSTATDTVADLLIGNNAATDWGTTEIILIRQYSEKYIKIVFSNTCDLGDILYHEGFEQTLWFESEPMENNYPLDEEGAKDGKGKFIRSFGRQVKKYIVRTKELPSYIIEVLYRMILHDSIVLTDLVGDENTVYSLEVEHEWLGEDKYLGKADLTFDYDEAFVIGGCCNNII